MGLRSWGTLAAITVGRVAFGYQVQTIATLGPDLMASYGISFATLGTLVGLYLAPGIFIALPYGFIGRRFGEPRILVVGFALMMAGCVVSGLAAGPFGIGAGRVLAGTGAVALTVLLGKIISDRYAGPAFMSAMGLLVGAYPIGIGLAQVTAPALSRAFGTPAPFLAGAALAGLALLLLVTTWIESATPRAPRAMAWPTRRECGLLIAAGLIWTSFNAGYANYLAWTPSFMAARGHPAWVTNLTMTLATWGNLPAALIGSRLAVRYGHDRIVMLGAVALVVSVAGPAIVDWPVLWGLIFGTLAALHSGVIIAVGTLSARPENRSVGMGLFYTTYFIGGAGIPALCGAAADWAGDPAGAFLCASALSALVLPLWWYHQHRWRQQA
jgi:MFS family permease